MGHGRLTRSLIGAAAVLTLLAGPADAAMRKGVEPNSWDWATAQWAPHIAGTHSQVVRLLASPDLSWPADLDAQVASARAAGARVIVCLQWTGYTPDPATVAAGAASVVQRFGPVDVELGNETNTLRFSALAVDQRVAAQAAIQNAAYDAVKASEPSARVILGGPAPMAGTTVEDWKFIRDVLARGGRADAVGVHPYASTPAGAITRLRSVRTVTSLPQVVTEFGWGSYSPDCVGSATLCVSEGVQAGYIVQTLNGMTALGYVTDATLYDLQDAGSYNAWDGRTGLLRRDGTAKPSYVAFRDWAYTPPAAPTPSTTPSVTTTVPAADALVVTRTTLRARALAGHRLVVKGRVRGARGGRAVLRIRHVGVRRLRLRADGTYRRVLRFKRTRLRVMRTTYSGSELATPSRSKRVRVRA
jgi:hypothetical protein